MSGMEFYHENLTLFNDFPIRNRPEELSPRAQLWVDEHAKVSRAAAEKYPTVENLSNLALARWLGDPAPGRIDDYWWQARQIVDHNVTRENEVNRSCALELATIGETILAWRVLLLVVETMHDEPVDRQAFTSYMAAAVAAAEGNTPLAQLFSSEADQLWKYAIEIGETSIDEIGLGQNRILLASFNAPEAGFSESELAYLGIRSDLVAPPEAIAHAQSLRERHMHPPEAVDAAEGGIL